MDNNVKSIPNAKFTTNLDFEKLKSRYKHIDFYYDKVFKNYKFYGFENFGSNDTINLNAIFEMCLAVQDMDRFFFEAECYFSKNYISPKTLEYLQLYIRAYVLEFATNGMWAIRRFDNVIKAFIAIYNNTNSKSVQILNNEIRKAYITLVQILRQAARIPNHSGVNNPEDMLVFSELLVNLSCIFPYHALDEYMDEVAIILKSNKYSRENQVKCNEILDFIDNYQKILHPAVVDITKFKTYNQSIYTSSTIDSVRVECINEEYNFAVIDIDFIETTPCNIVFNVSIYDDQNRPLPYQTATRDTSFKMSYYNPTPRKCGMVSVSDTIFAWPKNAKYIKVQIEDDTSKTIICEL